jgi:hypothetical protein
MRWAIGRSHTCKSLCPLFCHSTAILRRRACENTCCRPTLWLHLVAHHNAIAHLLTCLLDCLLSYWLARFSSRNKINYRDLLQVLTTEYLMAVSTARQNGDGVPSTQNTRLLDLSNRSSALRFWKHTNTCAVDRLEQLEDPAQFWIELLKNRMQKRDEVINSQLLAPTILVHTGDWFHAFGTCRYIEFWSFGVNLQTSGLGGMRFYWGWSWKSSWRENDGL